MTDIYQWLFGSRGKAAVALPIPPLPEELDPYRALINGSVRPYLGARVLDDAPASIVGSQLGGEPWWPASKAFPRDGDGHPLFLLAQVNFAELPVLPPLPRTGLLQIFIAADHLYGANLDDLQDTRGFRVFHHTDLTEPRNLRDVPRTLPASRGAALPLEDAFAARGLAFAMEAMAIDPTDYRFASILPEIAADDDLLELYAEWHEVSAVRLGGYPNFTQEDPRAYMKSRLGDFNLLTIDTTDGIMWGDSGVAQFFIDEADLKRADFSKVAYNWDCC